MSRGTGIRATRKPVVVVAGEDANDRRVLRLLMEAQCPGMKGRVVEISDSVRLHLATGANLEKRVETLARKARARAARERTELACIFIHEDLDAPTGAAYETARSRVQSAVEAEFGRGHYALAAAEVEAWLLLFPDALQTFVPSWSVPAAVRGRDTGAISDPKRVLRTKLSSAGRRYSESDAPHIVDVAIRRGFIQSPIGSNRSWTSFLADVTSCCAEHL